MPRLVVRKSNRAHHMQVIKYEENGDKVVASVNSRELKEMGWEPRCNIPTAYLTGLLLAKKWKGEGDSLDIGLYKPVKGSVVFAAAKGAQDGGLKLQRQHRDRRGEARGRAHRGYATRPKRRVVRWHLTQKLDSTLQSIKRSSRR